MLPVLILYEKTLNLEKNGNEVYNTAWSLLVIFLKMCSKLHCQKTFKLKVFSYMIRRSSPPARRSSTNSLAQKIERNVTKFAPRKALTLITWGKLTFYEMVVLHRVEPSDFRRERFRLSSREMLDMWISTGASAVTSSTTPLARQSHFDLTQCINWMVLESQLPHKIVNLLFPYSKLTILWRSWLSKTI